MATAAGDGLFGALGLAIVSDEAFAVGVTAIPGPFTDAPWGGWFWHEYFHLRGVAAQSQGADIPRNTTGDMFLKIDSKAQRKLGENQTIVGMIEVGAEQGTAGAVFVADTRMLFKLS